VFGKNLGLSHKFSNINIQKLTNTMNSALQQTAHSLLLLADLQYNFVNLETGSQRLWYCTKWTYRFCSTPQRGPKMWSPVWSNI